MLGTPKLSSKEKRQLDQLINSVRHLSNSQKGTEVQKYIKKRKLKAIASLLKVSTSNRIISRQILDIVLDKWPFKVRRLRKL